MNHQKKNDQARGPSEKQTENRPGTEQKNEGEGSWTAARNYNEGVQETIKSGKVDELADEAKFALDEEEGEQLRSAEKQGKMPDAQRTGEYTKTQQHRQPQQPQQQQQKADEHRTQEPQKTSKQGTPDQKTPQPQQNRGTQRGKTDQLLKH